MIVTITSYDQGKGKGAYRTPEGETVSFTYREFADEQMIPAGGYAELLGGILYPMGSVGFWGRLWLKIKEVMKWR
jgi:hypothetical protein